MAELKDNEIAVDREQFKQLLQLIDKKNEEIRALYWGSIKVMSVIGLAENGKIKADVFEEDGSPFSEVLKGASSVIGLAIQAGAPLGMGKKAEAKLKEKFGFFKELIPLFIIYGNTFGGEPEPKQIIVTEAKQITDK